MDAGSERLIVVSTDSHAGVPHELWEEYLPSQFHDLLPRLHDDNVVYPTMIRLVTNRLMTRPEYVEQHTETGFRGLYDAQVRLEEMDREGIAAETLFLGDFRLGDMFHNIPNDVYPLDAWEAGAKGWNRYVSDTFGIDTDRFLLVGAIGPCTDMGETMAELDWMADHDFTATYAPGYMRHADMPRPHDAYWDEYYSRCEEHGMPLVVHAGYGWDQGVAFDTWKRLYDAAVDSAGSTELADMIANPEGWQKLLAESGDFFSDIKPRQPMWQMMFGGVFDRHPDLKVMLTEIRADWLPPVLQHLDEVYEANRADLPAERKPSEYWASNFSVGVSFTHECEVGIRHDIGIEQFTFGRDYPHPESTWPHTGEWLRAAFAGVPEDELRLILGENAIRFLDLDRARLAEVAARIGPTYADINSGEAVDVELLDHFDLRGGYLKPPEGAARLELIDEMLRDDLAAMRSG